MNFNTLRPLEGAGRKLFVETYGCQMNVGDTEIVVALMQREGYVYTERIAEADVILINTCSIRDNAEQRIWGRLAEMKRYRRERPGLVVGVIGCMAERLRERLTEGSGGVDVVAGPDAYRDLPRLVRAAEAGSKGVNVRLSAEETYAEIARAALTATARCNNFCPTAWSPHTRPWKAEPRSGDQIVASARLLFGERHREVMPPELSDCTSRRGGRLLSRAAGARRRSFAARLRARRTRRDGERFGRWRTMASMRWRYFPAQSGAMLMLGRMNRKYISREWYRTAVCHPCYLPDCASDDGPHRGFSGETEEEHLQTLSLMREVGYEFAYMFKYSERPGTFAQKHLPDDVPDEVKSRRLQEIIALQNELGLASNRRDVGREFEVLVEGESRRDPGQLSGRTSQNKVVVFDRGTHGVGDYVRVRITGCTPATLLGEEVPAAG